MLCLGVLEIGLIQRSILGLADRVRCAECGRGKGACREWIRLCYGCGRIQAVQEAEVSNAKLRTRERPTPLFIGTSKRETVIIRNIEARLSAASVKPSDADKSVRLIEV